MDTNVIKPEPPCTRRRIRYGIRTMLFALVPVAIFFAWPGRWVFNYLRRQSAFAEIRERGGAVYLTLGRFAGSDRYAVKVGNADLSRLRDLADASSLDLTATKVTDSDLSPFRDSSNLVFVNLSNTAITDAGLANLKDVTNLRFLALQCTKVSDQGLIHLQGLKKLENLVLDDTQVGDAGLQSLQQCGQSA